MAIDTMPANPQSELAKLEAEYEAAKPFLKRLSEYWVDQHAMAMIRCSDAAMSTDQRTMAVGEVNAMKHAVSAHEFLYSTRVAYWTSKMGEYNAELEHERRQAESDGEQGGYSDHSPGELDF